MSKNNVQKLQALIELLEKATGPDRKVDEAIHFDVLGHERSRPFCEACGSARFVFVPEYTRSIDSALTLVPEGWAWFAQRIGGQFTEGDARLWIPSQRTQGLLRENFEARSSANPAIALCIAALKARVVLDQVAPGG